MENILFLVALLACPLGMLAMGGIAWVSAKAFRGRSNRLTRMTARASCMPGHNHGSPDSVRETGR
jgi:hypothetical protein